ncbi:hypothetical protein [Streptomyces sp. CB01881]|uniref:DUF6895 family protein n=1 Tax=Streptomyces sp. CB01881 TaxID=2078691 RepID=UPI001F11B42B|nr:hypothetical protein [Streptomyces sp. CB01881]
MNITQPGNGTRNRRAVETRAIAWLAARRALIDPAGADPDGVLFARKALIETAFLVGLRARLDPTPLDGDYTALLDQVQEITARPSYRELAARDEAALLLYAGTYAALRLCGREDTAFRRILEQAAAGGYAAAFERIPYRQLDLLHTLQLCGIGHDLPAMDEVLPFTLLCNRPNVVKLADRDIYAITHTVFYATDFGLRRPRWPSGFEPAEAVELLEALLVLTRARRNADLVGELLCCLRCLGVRDSQEADLAWQFLASVQEPDGRVGGPPGIVHPKLAAGDDHFRRWATGYHTTVVAALAALLERSPRLPHRPRPGTRRPAPDLDGPIHSAVRWLADASTRFGPDVGLPAAAAAALGASAVGRGELARGALHHFARLLTDLDPDAAGGETWQAHGIEVVGEFASGLRELGIACRSLDTFLARTAAAVADLPHIPPQARPGIQRLADLGLIPPGPAPADPQPPGDPSRAAEALAADLSDARRTYHLGRLAGIVRDLTAAGWADHRITRDAVAFLLSQQSADGAFGHPACDDPATRLRVRLSWTQSIVTALAATHRAQRAHPAPDRPAAAKTPGARAAG